MYHPTTRVLTLLELLQSHPALTGAEIAQLLEVNIRTARRYVAMLEDLGVPVTTDRGCRGGYRYHLLMQARTAEDNPAINTK